MKIQYLGTGAAEGWPALFCRCQFCQKAHELGGKNIRTRSQAIIDDALLVDFPPDTYHHVLAHDFPLPEVQHLLVTHSHMDHFNPTDFEMRGTPFSTTAEGILHIYGNGTVGLKYSAVKLDHRMPVAFHEVAAFEWFDAGDYLIMPLLANHDKKEHCYVFAIEKDGKRLLYLNDTGLLPEHSKEAIRGIQFDLVSMDCTTGYAKDGNNHMGVEDLPIMRRELEAFGCIKPSTVYVATHFSHNGGYMHHELEALLNPQGILVAYDGFTVEF